MDKERIIKIYNKYINATHRHHFVKKEYLSQWSKDGKTIFGMKKTDKVYNKYQLNDVCVSKNIYAINHHYSGLEIQFLKKTYENCPLFLRKEFDKKLQLLQFQTSDCFVNLSGYSDEGRKLGKGFQSQSGEDAQTRVEDSFFKILKLYVFNDDDSFLDDLELRIAFIVGLAMQYMRTNKKKQEIIDGINSLLKQFENQNATGDLLKHINPEAIWRGELEIVPYIMAYQLCDKRSGIEFIHSDSAFMTSDNPVAHVGNKDDVGNAINIKFLYPVSPSLCIIYPSKTIIRKADFKDINKINNKTIENSHLFIFKST